ncbi:MAG: hypothetical protein HN580_00085, partial [Deltaproteobacteria bacterium]|nr:hypothetical protein [Deltaproteobacteria bacterium]
MIKGHCLCISSHYSGGNRSKFVIRCPAKDVVRQSLQKLVENIDTPETQAFMDSLTGFEKHVFDRFPKSAGYLRFSGSKENNDKGTYISVKDSAGFLFP